MVIAAAALVVFVAAMRRRYGMTTALFSGVFSASRSVRWDSLGSLAGIVVLAVLRRGAPRGRAAIGIGVLLGPMLDVEGAVVAVFPAVVLLLARERPDRFARLARFALGFGAGVLVAVALHGFPYFGDGGGRWERVCTRPRTRSRSSRS